MALKGNLQTIQGLKKTLRAVPVTIAHDIAKRGAPVMTSKTRQAFAAGRNVYGEPRPKSVAKPPEGTSSEALAALTAVEGDTLTLVRTGSTAASLEFKSTGTIIRARLSKKYSKYLIGKYGILPNGAMPTDWSNSLAKIVADTDVKL